MANGSINSFWASRLWRVVLWPLWWWFCFGFLLYLTLFVLFGGSFFVVLVVASVWLVCWASGGYPWDFERRLGGSLGVSSTAFLAGFFLCLYISLPFNKKKMASGMEGFVAVGVQQPMVMQNFCLSLRFTICLVQEPLTCQVGFSNSFKSYLWMHLEYDPFTPLVKHIRRFRDLEWHLNSLHTLREDKFRADWLAKHWAAAFKAWWFFSICPLPLYHILLVDALRVTSTWF